MRGRKRTDLINQTFIGLVLMRSRVKRRNKRYGLFQCYPVSGTGISLINDKNKKKINKVTL